MDLPRRISQWANENQRTLDIAIALTLGMAATVATLVMEPQGSERQADWFAYVLIWGAAATILWRRTNPLTALLVAVAFVVPFWVLDYTGICESVLWVLFYSITRHGGSDRRKVWKVTVAGLAIVLGVATIGVIVEVEDLPAISILGIFIVYGTCASIGEALYQRSQHIYELEQRAASLETELVTKTALAAVDERTRIAREMHDIIAHGMSTIVVQSQAAQSIVETNPDRAKQVLETIETIGRDSVDEMRRMLGVLREEVPGVVLEPQPSVTNLDALRRQVDVEGVDLDLQVTGDERSLPPGLELAAYRIVQEALTNVLRHAGRPVTISAVVDYGDEELSISVSDNGRGAISSSDAHPPGHGLLGMRERVEIYNGSFHAGPQSGGGYLVRVALPLPARVSS